MLKKICTGLTLVAGVALVTIAISRIIGKKNEEDEEEDDGAPCKCTDCNCG